MAKASSLKKRAEQDGTDDSGKTWPDIVELRRQLGAVYGKPMASRNILAKLLGASPGSVFNWEHGKPPSRVYIPKLKSLAKQLSSGKITADTPVRRLRTEDEVQLRTPGRRGGIRTVEGMVPALYANVVTLNILQGEALIRFGLALPGDGAGRAVSDVVVPRELLERLAQLIDRVRD